LLPAGTPRRTDAEAARIPVATQATPATAAAPDSAPPGRTPPARALADPDLERLAERVIGSIDRRIAARRERLGRP